MTVTPGNIRAICYSNKIRTYEKKSNNLEFLAILLLFCYTSIFYFICLIYLLIPFFFFKDKEFDFFDEIEIGIEKFGKLGNTFITGDFNSRTAQLSDILPCDKPTLNKFDRLMTSTSKTEILNLSKYVFFASKLKQELT